MTIKWIVLAGNYREYTAWCRETMVPTKEALFVAEVSNLLGYDGKTVRAVTTGTFYLRPDSQEIREACRLRLIPIEDNHTG